MNIAPRAATAISALLDATDFPEPPAASKKKRKKKKAKGKAKPAPTREEQEAKAFDAIVKALSRVGKGDVPELMKGLERPDHRASWAAMTASRLCRR